MSQIKNSLVFTISNLNHLRFKKFQFQSQRKKSRNFNQKTPKSQSVIQAQNLIKLAQQKKSHHQVRKIDFSFLFSNSSKKVLNIKAHEREKIAEKQKNLINQKR